MKFPKTIQLKALMLVIVFSLNTVMSFACSLGLEMWYNKGHHSEIKKTETTRHCCQKSKNASDTKNNQRPPVSKDDCCTNSVINFQLMAKSIAQYNIDFSVPVSPLHHDMMRLLQVLNQFAISSEMKSAVFRTNQLPPPDIRVSIRSFQI